MYILQYSAFASGRPQVRKWGHQTCFLPREPSNFVTTLAVIQYTSALFMYMKWGVAKLYGYVGHNSLSQSSTFNVFLSHTGKLFANVNVCSFFHAALWFNRQGRKEGARGRNYPGAEWLRGRLKIPTMSRVHSSILYICFRKTSGSKMGAPNLHLAQGAI